MISRVCSEKRMPSPPMVMASDTPTVLYCHASRPSRSTAALTRLPNSSTGVGLDVSYVKEVFGEYHHANPSRLTMCAATNRVSDVTLLRDVQGTDAGEKVRTTERRSQNPRNTCKTENQRANARVTYLHGLPSHHTVATPTCAAFFIISRLGTPAPYSMAYR
jgi:hypothetical protein